MKHPSGFKRKQWRARPRLAALLCCFLFFLCGGSSSAQDWQAENSSRLIGQDQTISVMSGQSLYEVARAHGYSLELLAYANNLPISLAPVRQKSVVIPSRRIFPSGASENGIIVNLPERGFYLFRKGETPRFFPVAVGQPGRFQTPEGQYVVREKVVNPEWVAPEWAGLGEDNVVPAGPNNPLGDRWIGLSSAGLGMHSTNNPSSIGSASSHGCMRMYPEVARTVFDLVETGWPVGIRYETSRVAVEKDGVYVVCFTDPYNKGGGQERLAAQFQELDLTGFYHLLDLSDLLESKDGKTRRVVELDAQVVADGKPALPAARVGKRVFVSGKTLESLGIQQSFDLPNQTVLLKKGELEMVMPLRLTDKKGDKLPNKTWGFLSRGAAWFPAKELLQTMAIPYKWEGSSKTLLVQI